MSRKLSVVRKKAYPELTIDIIKQYINPYVSDQEAFWFLQLCKSQGLNPFTREAYLIKYSRDPKEPATMVVGKDAFLKRASRNPNFAGLKAGILVRTDDGEIEKREGTFYLKKEEQLLGGWAEVYRKDRPIPVKAEVSLDEYVQYTRDGRPNRSWSRMPATMIRKVALVQALRESFTEEFGGIYDAAEMPVEVHDLQEEPIEVEPLEETEYRSDIWQEEGQHETEGDNNHEITSESLAYQDWTDRIPANPKLLNPFIDASCKRFYLFCRHEFGFDQERAEHELSEWLGRDINSIRDAMANPELRRELNIAIFEETGKVLFQ